MAALPKVLIVDEPTRGIDIGAKAEIHRLLREYANAGNGVIVVSSEMPELIGLCDRILVLHEGRLAGEVGGRTATEQATHPSRHRLRSNKLINNRPQPKKGFHDRNKHGQTTANAAGLPPRKGAHTAVRPSHLLWAQPGSENPAELLALARDHGATAVLLTAGALRPAVARSRRSGHHHADRHTLSHIGGPDTIMHLLHTAEEAAALGADMVVLNCYVGIGDPQIESDLLKKLATVSAQCERLGLPLCGEIIPRVSYGNPAQTAPTSADLAVAIRLGLSMAATW